VLALDIGNGSIKFGVFADGRRVDGGRLPLDADLAIHAKDSPVGAVSVNPDALARLRGALPGLVAVGEDVPLPIPAYDGCGADRVLGVYGALARRPDAPGVLLIDAGTCLTATVGLRDGGAVGGAICPGPSLMSRALHEGTASLPLVEPGPSAAVGRTTEEAIRAGLRAAVHGAARELIRGCRAESPVPLDVVAAGTGAGPLAAALPEIDAVHPFATLWGVFLTIASPQTL